jgi:hypothetical protein
MYVTCLLVLLPEALVVIMIAVESGDTRNGIIEAAAGDLCASCCYLTWVLVRKEVTKKFLVVFALELFPPVHQILCLLLLCRALFTVYFRFLIAKTIQQDGVYSTAVFDVLQQR